MINRSILVLLALAALAGCAANSPPPNIQAQLTSMCAIAAPEITALQSVSADLSPKAQSALQTAAPLVASICAPGVVATSANLQQFTETVLPALTILAVEYAAQQKK